MSFARIGRRNADSDLLDLETDILISELRMAVFHSHLHRNHPNSLVAGGALGWLFRVAGSGGRRSARSLYSIVCPPSSSQRRIFTPAGSDHRSGASAHAAIIFEESLSWMRGASSGMLPGCAMGLSFRTTQAVILEHFVFEDL